MRSPSRTPANVNSSSALLIAAHCTTIRRKSKRIDQQEFAAILNDFVRELNIKNLPRSNFLNSLNEIVEVLNEHSPTILSSIPSHYFFIVIRNTVRDLLQQLANNSQLNSNEIYLLRNSILFFEQLLKKINDVSKVLHWITDLSLLEAFANCFNRIQSIIKVDEKERVIKQLTRLLNLFADVQERLPFDQHRSHFVKLFQPTINCLISSTYLQLFQQLKSKANSLTPKEKFYLVKCPYFLSNYNGPHLETKIEEVLELMLPRCVDLLAQHIKTIEQWHRPMMRAIHHLLNTMIFAEGCFTLFLKSQSIRMLIDHLLRLISEKKLIEQIQRNSKNLPSILINAALVILSVLVYETDAFDYLKQSQAARHFRQLISTSSERIVLNSYMMLVYTMTEDDLRTSSEDLERLFRISMDLLAQNRQNTEQKHSGTLLQLLEIIRGLIQHEQIRKQFTNRNQLILLMDCATHFQGLARQILFECLWTLAFDRSIAELIEENSAFLQLLDTIPKPPPSQAQSNVLRRSNSFSSRRTNSISGLNETNNEGGYQMADGLRWQLNQSSNEVQSKTNHHQESHPNFDLMISYSYNDKEIVQKIHLFLTKLGYRVWFNQDLNYRQAMASTATIIDHSMGVLLCLSDSYKRDNHCRAEAEYAATTLTDSKHFLLPIFVRKGCKIDGWLTSIITQDPWINFASEDFKTVSAFLTKEISTRGLGPATRSLIQTPIHQESDESADDLPIPPLETKRQPSPASHPHRSQSPTFSIQSRSRSPRAMSMNRASIGNVVDHGRLPEEYLKRDTTQSRYRSIPVKIWSKTDVLDFLYNANLNPMMPVCESMTGQGLTALFRMCQAKPSRLYSQLNDELRTRFRGYTLPMGVYTQFLIEMDGLVGPNSETIPSILPPPPKIIERLVYVPALPPTPVKTPVASNGILARSNQITPVKFVAESSTPRIIERAIFRPASSVGRPYNFVIESAQEPTILLQQVERYGPQLIFLDQKAREHRQRNVSQ